MKCRFRILLFCVAVAIAACQKKEEVSYQEKEEELLRELKENAIQRDNYPVGEYSGIFNIGIWISTGSVSIFTSFTDSDTGEAWWLHDATGGNLYNDKYVRIARLHNAESDLLVTVKGRLSPKGNYIHQGSYVRELIVIELLSVEEIKENLNKLVVGNADDLTN